MASCEAILAARSPVSKEEHNGLGDVRYPAMHLPLRVAADMPSADSTSCTRETIICLA